MTMNVVETDARRLLCNLGITEAKEWSTSRLQKRINALPDLIDEAKGKLEDADDLNLRDQLIEALEGGDKVTVVASTEAASKGNGAAKGKRKSPAPRPNTNPNFRPEGRNPQLFGKNAAQVIRLMGGKGFTYEDCVKVLDRFGVSMRESTVRTYLSDGKGEDEKKYGKKAILNPKDLKSLLAFRTAPPKKK